MPDVRSPWLAWQCAECGKHNDGGGPRCEKCFSSGFSEEVSAAYYEEVMRKMYTKKKEEPAATDAAGDIVHIKNSDLKIDCLPKDVYGNGDERTEETSSSSSSSSDDSDSDSSDSSSSSEEEDDEAASLPARIERETKEEEEEEEGKKKEESHSDSDSSASDSDSSSEEEEEEEREEKKTTCVDERIPIPAYREIVDKCRANGTLFVDPEFPHNMTSLGDFGDSEGKRDKEWLSHADADSVVWLAPKDIKTECTAAWSVMWEPQPSDVKQGSLGDCWLVCCVALLAERPDLLDRVMLTKQWSEHGVYAVRLYISGEWQTVIIDSFLPCYKYSKDPVFVSGKRNQLWMCLIEKALAKSRGSYARLSGGNSARGLEYLTGAPVESLDAREEKEEILWAKMLAGRNIGFIVCASISASSVKEAQRLEEYEEKGLVTGHAYSVLNVQMEGEERLVRVRNPWGSRAWTGAWSNDWDGWTWEQKNRLLVDTIHGSFWMSFDDFRTYFHYVEICRVQNVGPDWSESGVLLELGGKGKSARLLDVSERTQLSVTLSACGGGEKDEDLLTCIHRVAEKEREGGGGGGGVGVGECVARTSRMQQTEEATPLITLQPGKYIIIPHTFKGEKTRARLMIHSSVPLGPVAVACDAALRRDSLYQLVIKEGQRKGEWEGKVCVWWLHSSHRSFLGPLVVAQNRYSDVHAHLFTDHGSCEHAASTRASLQTADVLPPRSRQVLCALSRAGEEWPVWKEPRLDLMPSRSSRLDASWCAEMGIEEKLNPKASHLPRLSKTDQLHLPWLIEGP